MKQTRVGYEEKIGAFRAPASSDPENENSPMIQELIARLKFVASEINFNGKAILDYGCGTGIALQWVRTHFSPSKMVGMDISKGAITSAKDHYPDIDFRIINLESLSDDLRNEFDVTLCFEVLEHLRNPDLALSQLVNHYMKSDAIFVATTPNRLVFSSNMEPSPINRTHLHEMDLYEFSTLLQKHFNNVSIYGMRFKDSWRMKVYQKMVKHSCDGYKLFGGLWWNKWLSRFYRWIIRGELLYFCKRQKFHRWKAIDFEIVNNMYEMGDAIWFLALANN
jgi:2-polyprenyl-3-methyl-5-hydroxy-6-metoxy-1,4-benzoquinol methylase